MSAYPEAEHRDGRALTISMISVVFLVGCGGPTTGTYMDKQHARRFIACPTDDIEDPDDHTYNALLSTLADNNWVIERASRERLQIIARACTGNYPDPLKAPASKCLVLHFVVRDNGDAVAFNPPKQRVYSSILHSAKQWVQSLERTFSELRCYSDEKLSERTADTNSTVR